MSLTCCGALEDEFEEPMLRLWPLTCVFCLQMMIMPSQRYTYLL